MKTPAELFSLKGKVAVVIGGTGVLCGEMAEGIAIAGATGLPYAFADKLVRNLAAWIFW